jgi:hypothetical protein
VVDLSTARAVVVVAAVTAAAAAAWRTLVDTLPVPSLVDRNNDAGVPRAG